MRRIFLTAVASSAMALAVPGVAAAHHGKSHGSSRSASSHHKRHHRHARIMRFGSAASAPTSGSTSTPTSPTTTLAGESAGTVTSFTNEVLTITLKDGTTVSGKVTEKTEIECAPSAPMAAASSHDGGGDQGGQGQLGSQQEGGEPGQDGGHDGQGEDQGDDNGEASQQSCTTAALVPGAAVREAELSVGGAGAVWQKVELGQ
jgi:hypothetical protein